MNLRLNTTVITKSSSVKQCPRTEDDKSILQNSSRPIKSTGLIGSQGKKTWTKASFSMYARFFLQIDIEQATTDIIGSIDNTPLTVKTDSILSSKVDTTTAPMTDDVIGTSPSGDSGFETDFRPAGGALDQQSISAGQSPTTTTGPIQSIVLARGGMELIEKFVAAKNASPEQQQTTPVKETLDGELDFSFKSDFSNLVVFFDVKRLFLFVLG